MKESKVEVKTYLVTAKCIDCGVEYEYTGNTFCTNPPQYEYECPNCKRTHISNNKYPRIIYEEIKGI